MSGYLWTVHYNTAYTKDILYIIIAASNPVEACIKAEGMLQEDGMEIMGCSRLV